VTIEVRVPYRVVGLVVGPKGASIKRIQHDSQTYIVTPSRDRDPVFVVSGLRENVERARREIESYIAQRTRSGALSNELHASDGRGMDGKPGRRSVSRCDDEDDYYGSVAGEAQMKADRIGEAARMLLGSSSCRPEGINASVADMTSFNNAVNYSSTTGGGVLSSPMFVQRSEYDRSRLLHDSDLRVDRIMYSLDVNKMNTTELNNCGIGGNGALLGNGCYYNNNNNNILNLPPSPASVYYNNNNNFPQPSPSGGCANNIWSQGEMVGGGGGGQGSSGFFDSFSSLFLDDLAGSGGVYPSSDGIRHSMARGGSNSFGSVHAPVAPPRLGLTLDDFCGGTGGDGLLQCAPTRPGSGGSLARSPSTSPTDSLNGPWQPLTVSTIRQPSRRCVACSDSDVVAALVPCGHNSFCMECASAILSRQVEQDRRCPICLQPAALTVRILS